MIKPYNERDKIAAHRRWEERVEKGLAIFEVYDQDTIRDIQATGLWFYHRQLCIRPSDIVEDELKFGGTYTSDSFKE